MIDNRAKTPAKILPVVTLAIYILTGYLLWQYEKQVISPVLMAYGVSGAIILVYQMAVSMFYTKVLHSSEMAIARYYLLSMTGELTLSAIIVAIGVLILSKSVASPYVIAFGIFFILSLTCESIFFILTEKRLYEKTINK